MLDKGRKLKDPVPGSVSQPDAVCGVSLAVVTGSDEALFAPLVGRIIVAVRRGQFLFQEETPDASGFLELTFVDGAVVHLDIGSDWTLRVEWEAWVDVFAPPLSPENAAYVECHGKWSARDVSREMPYSAVVGRRIEGVEPWRNEMNELQGATFVLEGGGRLRATQWGGELWVNRASE